MSAKLFDMLSTSTEVDHPMCEECADLVTDELQLQLGRVRAEAALYRNFVQQLKKETPPPETDQPDTELEQVPTGADGEVGEEGCDHRCFTRRWTQPGGDQRQRLYQSTTVNLR